MSLITALVVTACLQAKPSECATHPLVVAHGPVSACVEYLNDNALEITERLEKTGLVVTALKCIPLDENGTPINEQSQ